MILTVNSNFFVYLNSINWLIFVMVMLYVVCEVGTDFRCTSHFIILMLHGCQLHSTRFIECHEEIRRSADKSLAFPIFLSAAQSKEFFLDGLKKLGQRSHKCVELKGEYVE
jgi:hypothetical protein